MALRQRTGFVGSLLRLSGLDWSVPDFRSLGRPRKTLAATIPYHGSEGPRHLAIDSTGINAEGEAVALVPSLPPRKNAKPWKPDSAGAIAPAEAGPTARCTA